MLSNIDFGSYFHTKKYEKGLSTGGDKIADWGGSKGGWGGHVPPSLYVKRGPVECNLPDISACPICKYPLKSKAESFGQRGSHKRRFFYFALVLYGHC